MRKPTVAVLGASSNRSKFGNKSVRAHLRAGYDVYPVNPNEDAVEGLECYPSISQVPAELDRVTVYLHPNVGLREIQEIADSHPKEVWLNPGAESDELVERGKELGLNMIKGCSIVDLGLSPGEFPA